MSWILLLSRIFVFTFLFTHGHGFNFVVSPPTQCGSERFTWVGGTPPFYALVIPPDGTLLNVSIPASAWNEQDQSGDFSTVLPFAQNKLVVFSMGDATGQTTGGISSVMTVGPPVDGAPACNISDPGVQFFFATDEALVQCKDYPFSLFTKSGAVLPITVLVTIPNSESFSLHPPNNSDPFVWNANLTAGTSVLFTMTDAQNRVGGTSSLTTVQESDDSSCVHPLPSSAAPTRTPSPSGTAPATTSGVSGGGTNHSDNSSSTGIIVGASVGGAAALIIIIALVYIIAKRSGKPLRNRLKRIDLTETGPDSSTYLLPSGHPQQAHYPPMTLFPPYQDSITPFQASPSNAPPTATYGSLPPGAVHIDASMTGTTDPFTSADIHSVGAANATLDVQAFQPPMSAKQHEAMLAQQQYHQDQQHQLRHQEYFDPYDPASLSATTFDYPTGFNRQTIHSDTLSQFGVATSSNVNSIAGPSNASSYQGGDSKQRQSTIDPPLQPQRFIVHTDIEDDPIELPPMYSESRAPLAGLPSTGTPRTGRNGIQ